jgi:hypothetical protein
MLTAFGFLYIYYFQRIPLNDYPALHRMTLFFPE